MSDLKFVCPSCGQHIQCENAHAGENIPCPACARMIRIPAADKPAEDTTAAPTEAPVLATEIETPALAAEMVKPTTPDNPFDTEMTTGAVSYTPIDPAAAAPGATEPSTAPAPPQQPKPAPEPPSVVQPAPAETNAKELSVESVQSPSIVPELRCVCPVCQSELRIPMNIPSASNGSVAPAEHVIATQAVNHHSDLAQTKHEPIPLAERERKIAEARETQQVSAYPKMKPRLSVILNDEARTITPADSAPPTPSSEVPQPPLKSLTE